MSENENIKSLNSRFLGRCFVCGKALANSESIEQGIGPICSRKYQYLLDNVTSSPNEDKVKELCSKIGIDINFSAGLNKASNQILRKITEGMSDSDAEIALDAIQQLGFVRLAAVVGSALHVSRWDGASLDKATVTVTDRFNNSYIELITGKIVSSHWNNFVEDTRKIYGRRWDKDKKANVFPMLPQAAKGVVALCERWFPFASIDERVINLSKMEDVEVQKPVESMTKINKARCILKEDGLYIYTPGYNGAFVSNLKAQIPGFNKKWMPNEKCWVVDKSYIEQGIKVTMDIYPDAILSDNIANYKNELQKQIELATASTVDSNEEINLTGGKLYPFQSAGVQFLELKLKDNGGAIIADEMGLGKTVQSLAFLSRDLNRVPALICCPASVKLNWGRQLRLWTNNQYTCVVFNGNYFHIINEKGRMEKNKYNTTLLNSIKPQIVICNYDLLKKYIDLFSSYGFKTIVLDESHYVKEYKSARSKAAKTIAYNIPYRILLTGTPVLNRPKELWHQLHICDPKHWGKFLPFAYKYCDPEVTRWGTNFNGSSNLDELHERIIGHFMVRRTKKEVLKELPDKNVYNTVFDIDEDDRKEYDYALNDFRNWAISVGGIDKLKSVERAEAIAKLTTLKRLCAKSKINTVTEYCKEWIDSNEGQQLIIAAHHQEVIQSLENKMKENNIPYSSIKGGDSAQQRQDAVDKFKAGDSKVFIASILAAGTGTDGLQVCQNMKIIERTWRPADMEQLEGRVHRIGQDGPVFIEYLDMENSIDTAMANIIQEKLDIIKQIVDGSSADIGDISESVMVNLLKNGNDK